MLIKELILTSVVLIVCADNVEWASETPKSLWKKIIDEVQTYFGYRFDWLVICHHVSSLISLQVDMFLSYIYTY